MSKHHPMQPVEMAEDHVVRFKRNQIICDMQELCARHGLDLNEIAIRDYSKDDRSQLMQLIGYSVSGYGNLSCARAKHVMRADQKADGLGVDHNSAPQNDDTKNVARHEWYEGDIPPVGLAFEFTSNGGHNWGARTILYKDDSVILLDGYQLFKLADPDIGFRPALTPEQIAADERDQARTEVLNAMTADDRTKGENEENWQFRMQIVGEMLDMGYRKQ